MNSQNEAGRILIIEDDQDFRFMLKKALERKGFDVSEAGCYEEAEKCAEEYFFPLVLSDIRLPGRDGIDAVMRIKEIQKDKRTFVIIMTGFSDKEALIRAIKLGVDDYIAKPFTMEEFYHSIDQNMRSFQLEREKIQHLERINKYNALLANKNEYLGSLLSSLAEGFFTVNAEMKITQFNKILERITGYRQDEVLGKKCNEVFGNTLCCKGCPLLKAMEMDSPILTIEAEIKRRDGQVIPIVLSAAAIRDGKLNIIGGVEVIRDISEFKRITRELEESKQKIESWGKDLEKVVHARTKELEVIYNVGKEISSTLNLKESLEVIIRKISEVMNVKICSILLVSENKEDLKVSAHSGLDASALNERIRMGENISGWVAEARTPLIVEDIEKDERFAQMSGEKYYKNSLISVPLIVQGEVIGVLNVNEKASGQPFVDHDLMMVTGIAQQSSIAIQNAKLYSSLQGTYMNVVMSLMAVIDAKDHYTNSHSHQVTLLGLALAKEIGLSQKEMESVGKACLLHDIGNIAVHDAILTKEGALTEEERQEIQEHPVKSFEILKPLAFLEDVNNIIKQHHERFDGSGYPDGLKGEEILVGARLMAIVDSFSAMISQRPYRNSLTVPEAKEELIKNKGSLFDPALVDTFLGILDRDPEIVNREFQSPEGM